MPNINITTKFGHTITILDPETFDDQENILASLKHLKKLLFIHGAHETSLIAAIELLDALMFIKINPDFLAYAAENKDDLAIYFTQDLSNGLNALLMASEFIDGTLYTISHVPFNIKSPAELNSLINETEKAYDYLNLHEETASLTKHFLAHIEPHLKQFADDGLFHALQYIKKVRTGELNNLDTLIAQGIKKASVIGITKENKPIEFLLYLLQIIEPEFNAEVFINIGDKLEKTRLTPNIFKDILVEKLNLDTSIWAKAATMIGEHRSKRALLKQKIELIFDQKELWKATAFRAFARIQLGDDLKEQIDRGRIKEIAPKKYGLIFTNEQLELIKTQAAPSHTTTLLNLLHKVSQNILKHQLHSKTDTIFMFYAILSPWLGKTIKLSDKPTSPYIEITENILKEKALQHLKLTPTEWNSALDRILKGAGQHYKHQNLFTFTFKQEERWLCEGMYAYVRCLLPLKEYVNATRGEPHSIEVREQAGSEIKNYVRFTLNTTQLTLLRSLTETPATTTAMSSNPYGSFAASSSAAASSSSRSSKQKASAKEPTVYMIEDDSEEGDSDKETSPSKKMRK